MYDIIIIIKGKENKSAPCGRAQSGMGWSWHEVVESAISLSNRTLLQLSPIHGAAWVPFNPTVWCSGLVREINARSARARRKSAQLVDSYYSPVKPIKWPMQLNGSSRIFNCCQKKNCYTSHNVYGCHECIVELQ